MNVNEAVDIWFESYDNPQKPLVQAVRESILKADDRIQESIKWKAPTFSYKGNLASFFPRSKKHVTLMFHKGATIAGEFPNLEGDGKEARTMKFYSIEDLQAKSEELAAITVAWCDQQDA